MSLLVVSDYYFACVYFIVRSRPAYSGCEVPCRLRRLTNCTRHRRALADKMSNVVFILFIFCFCFFQLSKLRIVCLSRNCPIFLSFCIVPNSLYPPPPPIFIRAGKYTVHPLLSRISRISRLFATRISYFVYAGGGGGTSVTVTRAEMVKVLLSGAMAVRV